MKRIFSVAATLLFACCLALPSASFARGNHGAGNGPGVGRSLNHQERNIHQQRYRYETPEERQGAGQGDLLQERSQSRDQVPDRDRQRQQTRDPSTHVPEGGTE